ncbi:glycosyltransferase family 32 protein [Curvularia clavata]|uniref:Glycosyltransferase family 32 protein n=1 Tax=Curvularia clavata TaxID=95742 RepID=A0A9Q8Z0F0_CURCL|nr:glycosyltransferase family 32 protein [Curvularia clavata]
MRARISLIRGAFLIPVLLALNYIRRLYIFQSALPSLEISFDDFPLSYASALNASQTNNEALTAFDYEIAFPAPLIPRIVHFIHFADLYYRSDGTPSLPATSLSHAPELCRTFNPTYEIRIWNSTAAREFLEAEYAWFLPTYDGYPYPIQRVDALKYFVLYHFGGIYMDLDIACRRALDPLLHFPAWWPQASPLGVNNDLMASVPRHPILMEMTRRLVERNRSLIFPYITIFWSTGPQFTSDSLREWWRHCKRTRNSNGVVIDPFVCTDAASFRILPQIFYSEEYTFFGHSPGGPAYGSSVY